METNLIYIPTFRARQQEILVFNSFNFGNNIFPCIEIVKEHDRVRKVQKSFREIYTEIIGKINARKVFVDLPVYLKVTGSTQDEVIAFNSKVLSVIENRIEYFLQLSNLTENTIPIVSSFILKTGVIDNSIEIQVNALRPQFASLGFRTFVHTFEEDITAIERFATENDFVILDLDTTVPFSRSTTLRDIVDRLGRFNTCPKIILRSAINDIKNMSLDHGSVVTDADNSLLEVYNEFHAQCFGDYCGIKKDDLSAGGAISPGFILFDAVSNRYYGFKSPYSSEERSLADFADIIVPDIINSPAAQRMRDSGRDYLSAENRGWQTLLNIQGGSESGKSQAKFKRIAMEHYLHCMKIKIEAGDFN